MMSVRRQETTKGRFVGAYLFEALSWDDDLKPIVEDGANDSGLLT
jgi:hypothetical protein